MRRNLCPALLLPQLPHAAPDPFIDPGLFTDREMLKVCGRRIGMIVQAPRARSTQ